MCQLADCVAHAGRNKDLFSSHPEPVTKNEFLLLLELFQTRFLAIGLLDARCETVCLIGLCGLPLSPISSNNLKAAHRIACRGLSLIYFGGFRDTRQWICHIRSPWSIFPLEIKLLQNFGPSGLSPTQLRLRFQIRQRAVVRDQFERSALQVASPQLNGVN